MIPYCKEKLASQEILPKNHLMKGRNLYYTVLCEYYSRVNTVFNSGYGDWDKIIRVNPKEIKYVTFSDNNLEYGHGYLDVGAFDVVKQSGAIVNGAWDKKNVEFEDLYIYQSIYNVHKRGFLWEETCYFKYMCETIKNGGSLKGCTSIKDIQEHCKYIDSLLNEIRVEGYKSQRELGKVPVSEVTVNIGREGELFFNDGRHRLSISKVLEIDKIPVRILAIHEEVVNRNPEFLKKIDLSIK